MNSWIFEELNKSKIHDNLLKFINEVKSNLDIVFPKYVNYFLINQEITNAIINKKLNENIIIRLLYCYNDNTKNIVKRLSPFLFSKILEYPINDVYLFIRDNNDFLILDINKTLSVSKKMNSSSNTASNDPVNEDATYNLNDDINSAYLFYSNNESLLLCIRSFFQAIWFQKENYDKIIEEKSHSDLLVDLITHDIGNHHTIIQGSIDLITDLIDGKINYDDNADTNTNNVNDQYFANSSNDEDKNYVKNQSNSPPFSDFENISNDNDKRVQIIMDRDLLKDIKSNVSIIQNALDKSQDLVKNIIKLERMYRQKEVYLYRKNILESIEEAKWVFRAYPKTIFLYIIIQQENCTSPR
jgi:hypothetical protein